jgi:hypothetical protein
VDNLAQKLGRNSVFSADNFIKNLLVGEPEFGAGSAFRELFLTAYASAAAAWFG